MSRHISIALALLVLAAITVLTKLAVDQRDQSALTPSVAFGTAGPADELPLDSSMDVAARRASDGPLASSGSYPLPADTGATQQQTSAVALSGPRGFSSGATGTEQGTDPNAVAADMAGGGPIAAIRPPSGGPSTIDLGSSGPSPPTTGSDTTHAAGVLVVVETAQPVASTDTPTSVGPGPSETDLQLPGPGESAE